jgi:hypothetical protein
MVRCLDVLCDLSHPDDRNFGSHNVDKKIELKGLLLAIKDSQITDEFPVNIFRL